MKISPYVYPGLKDTDLNKMESIVLEISYKLQIPIERICGKQRDRPTVESRHLAMYFILKLTKLSLKQVGQFFSGRDHSTVIYARETVNDLVRTDREFCRKFIEIEKLLL